MRCRKVCIAMAESTAISRKDDLAKVQGEEDRQYSGVDLE
jgi:hypothetical protein